MTAVQAVRTSEVTAARKEEIRQRYADALESFVAKVKQDHHIIAGILFGSLSYDEVWEKSDIDIMLIAREGFKRGAGKSPG